MFDVGGGELIIILLFVLLLFGPKKIPEFAQMVGKGLRKFRMAQEELTQQIRDISADAAINEDSIARKASSTTPIDVTTPIIEPRHPEDIVARNTPMQDVIARNTAVNNAVFGADIHNDPDKSPDDREGSPS